MLHTHKIGLKKPSGGLYKIRPIRIIETNEVFDNAAVCARYINGDVSAILRNIMVMDIDVEVIILSMLIKEK